MLNILKIAKKEVDLIRSQRIAVILIVVYPLLTIISVAVALSSGGAGLSGTATGIDHLSVGLYVPAEAEDIDANVILSQFSKIDKIRLNQYDSIEALKEGIGRGKNRVGIIVLKRIREKGPIDVNLLYDNTSMVTAKAASTFVYLAVNSAAYQQSADVLKQLWDEADSIRQSLESEKGKVDVFIERIRQSALELEDFNRKISSFTFEGIEQDFEQFEKSYEDSKAEIANAKNDVKDTKDKLEDYRADLQQTRETINSYHQRLIILSGQLHYTISQTEDPAVKSSLQAIETELNSRLDEIGDSINKIDEVLGEIDVTKEKLDDAEAKLDQAAQVLDDAKEKLSSYELVVADLKETFETAKEIIDTAYASQIASLADLEATKEKLDDLLGSFEAFDKYDPSALLNPIRVKEIPLYRVNKLAIMTPISIALVLLLTCILLTSIAVILERNQGAAFRAKLSPTGRVSWFSGKILGQLVFAMIESTILIVFAVFAFGVDISALNLNFFIAIAASCFAFINIGLLLTNFTDSQSTVVLSALVLIIPQLFLSGILFPFEFMPEMVANFAQNLPLSLTVDILTATMIRGFTLVDVIDKLAVLLAISFGLLFFTIMNKYK